MTHKKSLTLLVLATAIYAALAAILFTPTFFPLLEGYSWQLTNLPVALVLIIPLLGVAIAPRAPLSWSLRLLQRRGLHLVPVFAVFTLGMTAFTTFKIFIPQHIPFYADPLFADIDAALHFGNPGDWAHLLIPSWAQYPLAYLYGPVWFLLWLGLLAFVTLHAPAPLRARYYWSMALAIFVLGTVAATTLSSVGPIFYAEFFDPTRFANLKASIQASPIGDYMEGASGYLLSNYQAGDTGLGTGISAMPSMHLAVVTLNALMLVNIGRWAGVFGWTYVVLILLGSVFLGWHYAIDGYVSILTVCGIWWGVGRILSRHSPVHASLPNPNPCPRLVIPK